MPTALAIVEAVSPRTPGPSPELIPNSAAALLLTLPRIALAVLSVLVFVTFRMLPLAPTLPFRLVVASQVFIAPSTTFPPQTSAPVGAAVAAVAITRATSGAAGNTIRRCRECPRSMRRTPVPGRHRRGIVPIGPSTSCGHLNHSSRPRVRKLSYRSAGAEHRGRARGRRRPRGRRPSHPGDDQPYARRGGRRARAREVRVLPTRRGLQVPRGLHLHLVAAAGRARAGRLRGQLRQPCAGGGDCCP